MKYIGLLLFAIICGTCSWVSAFSVGPINFTRWDAQDPYYEMESHNLNTMGSYFVPADPMPLDKNGWVDLADYVHVARDTQEPSYILTNSDVRSNAPSVIHYMSSYNGVWFMMICIVMIARILSKKSESSIAHTITLWLESIYEFFEDILGNVPRWISLFVLSLFSIIFLSNLLAWLSDMIRFAFPWLLRNFTAPTAELEFNIALALVATGAILYAQAKSVWWIANLVHEYVPVFGKWIMPNKLWDSVISLFIGLLDIVGLFARIVSLSLRLFGNMSVGSILLNVTFLWLGAVTVSLLSTNLAIGLPIIVYIQWSLSVLIQAFVFSLIVAIGLRMAHDW